jgi:anti-sigma factor RsiW
MTPPHWLTFWRKRPAPAPDCGGLSCRELVELVTDYLEDMLAPDTRARFERHIASCGYCTRYMLQMRETLQVVGHLDPEALDPRVEAELLVAFRDWKQAADA